MPIPQYFDFFGNPFTLEEINNRLNISQFEDLSLDTLSPSDIATQVVVVSENNGRAKYAYLLSELADAFKANNYQRLESFYTREDLTDKIPIFKTVAAVFEEQAIKYNAYILNKNPKFLTLLTAAIEVLLDTKDSGRTIDVARDDINANQDVRMVAFYSSIAAFTDEERKEFDSLFILNRTFFAKQDSPLITLPTKWQLSDRIVPVQGGYMPEKRLYDYFVGTGNVHIFPHRNVLIGDLIRSPDDACMHSWGFDILYLLQEHHLTQGRNLNIFSRTNVRAFAMEEDIKQRINSKRQFQLVNPESGRQLIEWVQHAVDIDSLLRKVKDRFTAFDKALADFQAATADYTNPDIQRSIIHFCAESKNICLHLSKGIEDDSLFKSTLAKQVKECAHQYFVHQHKILRILADCVFLPLGILSLGSLFLAKKWLTGSYFFSTALTNREERLKSTVFNLEHDEYPLDVRP